MKSAVRYYLLLGSIIFCAICTNARIVKDTPTGTIPFAIAGDSRIYVTAFVNGSDSLRFLVDTGASDVVLNPNSPKLKDRFTIDSQTDNLGTTGENTISYSNQNALRIGSLQLDKVGCAIIEYPAEYWDGVLGLGALRLFNIEINYDDFKIYFYDKNTNLEIENNCTAFPFEYIYNVPFITLPISINGENYNLTLEVDTGSDRVIDLNTPFVQNHNLLDTQKPFAISRIASSDGGSGELRNVFFDEVVVGKYHLPLVTGAFSTLTSGMQSKEDIDGMIGNNFLKRFNMVMDFKNNKLFLKPNKFLYSPFYDFLLP